MESWLTTMGSVVVGGLLTGAVSIFLSLQNAKNEKEKLDKQINHNRLSTRYRDRKECFKKIIPLLHFAISAIENSQRVDEPLDSKSSDYLGEFASGLREVTWCVEEEVGDAIDLFGDVVAEVAQIEPREPLSFEDGKKIDSAYNQLAHLYTKITKVLRVLLRIDVSEEEVALGKLARDVKLLGACRFLTEDRFYGLKFPGQKRIELDESQTALDLLEIVEIEPAQFVDEFSSFCEYLKNNPGRFESEQDAVRAARSGEKHLRSLK